MVVPGLVSISPVPAVGSAVRFSLPQSVTHNRWITGEIAARTIQSLWVKRVPTAGLSSYPDQHHLSWVRQSILDVEDKCLYTSEVWFERDPPKAVANLRTHGVSFVEAVTVFKDDFALTRKDPDATDELRLVTSV